MINPKLKIGDSVVLLDMENEENVTPGTWGTVTRISHVFGTTDYGVKWDFCPFSKKGKVMVGYWTNLTFFFGKENVKFGIYEIFFWQKSGCDWVSVGP
jgi:hypothetical protein